MIVLGAGVESGVVMKGGARLTVGENLGEGGLGLTIGGERTGSLVFGVKIGFTRSYNAAFFAS